MALSFVMVLELRQQSGAVKVGAGWEPYTSSAGLNSLGT